MAETIRTRSEILALLLDNTSGLIDAQELRDMLVSLFSVWGAIYVNDGAIAQAGITTTPEKLTGFTADVAGIGMTPDHTDDSIAVLTDGDYIVVASISFSGTNNTEFELHVNVDGVETPFGTHRKLGASGDVGSAIILAPLTGLVVAEKITIYVNTVAGSGQLTLVDSTLFALKVS